MFRSSKKRKQASQRQLLEAIRVVEEGRVSYTCADLFADPRNCVGKFLKAMIDALDPDTPVEGLRHRCGVLGDASCLC